MSANYVNGHSDSDRAAINRANSQHSTGPVTPEGKASSSQNALKHGLTAKAIVLPSEDPAAYQRHLDSFLREYQPNGPSELAQVHTLASASWRLQRVDQLEEKLFSDPDENLTLDSQMRALATLSSHRHRLTRDFDHTLKQLRQAQHERWCKEQGDLDKAAQLCAMDQDQGIQYDPSKDGFVFSKDEVEAHIKRDRRHYDAVQHSLGHDVDEGDDE